MNLSSPVTILPGVGSILAGKLSRLDIQTVFDLLYHLPFRYEDRSALSSISLVQAGETVCLQGTIDFLKNDYTHHGKLIQKGQITDASGSLPLIWFNQTFLTKNLKKGTTVALYGKVDNFAGKPTLVSPDYELVTPNHELIHTGRLVPIYGETSGITSKWLRTKIFSILPQLKSLDPFPQPAGLLDWSTALLNIHFPAQLEQVGPARHRLAYDELFILQLRSLNRRTHWQSTRLAHTFNVDQDQVIQFINSLPFTLTPSQNSTVKEILTDLSGSKPMNRLLEGDVGSGKTVVAAIAAFVARQNGFISLVLAPTQILAAQHHQTLSTMFKPFGLQVGLVTGNHKSDIGNLKFDIVVGTHALLTTKLELGPVGLVVIDEQHRFGVLQRALASRLGSSPHILTMTATPIPRTIALTLLGELNISVLANPPSGRLPVKTWLVPESKRDSAYNWIKSQISTLKTQAFIVCPFIEPSETLTSVKAATAEFTKLEQVLSPHRLGLLHGKLSVTKKNQVLADFRSGKIQILVTTPVVEVGIDIPNASIMVIEGAERFGLAQLHQLRGRVGRNSNQAYCLLFSSADSARLKAMEILHSGLELAETDLRLRGPGEIYGTVQHGLPKFKVATFEDLTLIETAKQAAGQILPQINTYETLHNLLLADKMETIDPN